MTASILLTALVLIVAGVALYFAFQKVKADFETDRRKLVSLVRVTNARVARRIKKLETDYAMLEARADREEGTIKPPANQFTRSEQRHIDQAKSMNQVVSVPPGQPGQAPTFRKAS